jgi:phosphate transport system protein
MPECDKSAVLAISKTVTEMISLSVKALESKDKDAANKLYQMDDAVDTAYREYFRKVISNEPEKKDSNSTPKCYASALLILRYLERISDHACYIGDSVHYIVTGESSPRR